MSLSCTAKQFRTIYFIGLAPVDIKKCFTCCCCCWWWCCCCSAVMWCCCRWCCDRCVSLWCCWLCCCVVVVIFAVSLMMLLYYVAVDEVVKIRVSIQFSFVWKHLSQVLCWRNFARGRHNEISACVGDFLSKKKNSFFSEKICFLFFLSLQSICCHSLVTKYIFLFQLNYWLNYKKSFKFNYDTFTSCCFVEWALQQW